LLSGSGVLLRGAFNPSIFQPAWFAREGLIPVEEADTATINIIHSQVASFETPSFRVQVTNDTFEVAALGRPFTDLVRDLAYGAFSILHHTPMTALGMNNFHHFQARSEDTWHQLGHEFAPKDFWNPLLKSPGMQGITIRGQREDDLVGWVDVRVEPSLFVLPNGVFVHVNDHVQLTEGESAEGAQKLMQILTETWSKASERAERIISAVGEKIT
jgi:hypothetical protein